MSPLWILDPTCLSPRASPRFDSFSLVELGIFFLSLTLLMVEWEGTSGPWGALTVVWNMKGFMRGQHTFGLSSAVRCNNQSMSSDATRNRATLHGVTQRPEGSMMWCYFMLCFATFLIGLVGRADRSPMGEPLWKRRDTEGKIEEEMS
jgi:hypothetical protein